MRRFAYLAFSVLAGALFLAPTPSHAQYGGGGPGGGGGQQQQQDDDDAKSRKRNEEWGTDAANLPLPQLRNAGPCPYVKVLYDAARYVELDSDSPNYRQVGYTGEIQNLASACEYKSSDPIKVQARILFALGRGPNAQGNAKTYRYWVAVTDRDRAVLAKEYFDLPVTFPAGQDRVTRTEDVLGITIPRANVKVSGANFEVLVGFDVDQKMADFNHNGERFRENAGVNTTTAQAAAPPPKP